MLGTGVTAAKHKLSLPSWSLRGKQTWNKSALNSLPRDRGPENQAGKSQGDQDKLLCGVPSAE